MESLPVVAVICFVSAVILWSKRPSCRRVQSVLMLIAGAGIAGKVGALRDYFTARASTAGDTLSDRLFGAGVPYIAALIICLYWVIQMDLDGLYNKLRKKGKGSGRTSATAFTPVLSLFVIPALAVLPWVGGAGPAFKDLATDLFTGVSASAASGKQ